MILYVDSPEYRGSFQLLDTFPAHGAQSWEAMQIYAPNLVIHNETIYDFYNANSGKTEQTGL